MLPPCLITLGIQNQLHNGIVCSSWIVVACWIFDVSCCDESSVAHAQLTRTFLEISSRHLLERASSF